MKQQSLDNQIAAAQAELEALAAERLNLPEQMREASAKGDSAAIVKLRARAAEIPTHGAAARIKLERLKLADATNRRADLQGALLKAKAALDASRSARDEAEKKLEADHRAYLAAPSELNAAVRQIEASEQVIANMEKALTDDSNHGETTAVNHMATAVRI